MLQLLDDNLLSICYGCFAHHYKILVYYKMGSCQALQRFCQLIVGKAISILKRAKKCKCLKTCNPEKGSCKQFALPYTKLCLWWYCTWETLLPNLLFYQTERVNWPIVFFVQPYDSLIFMIVIFLGIQLF